MISGRSSTIVIGKTVRSAWLALLVATSAALTLVPTPTHAAIGCTLSNPAEDLKYLYPEMTSYKEDLKEFAKLAEGRDRFNAMRERLGSDLDPIYETYETPYTVYSVYKNQAKIGVVHGVNVPGKGGVIQVFVSVDPTTATIRKLFFQRLESPAASQLRDKKFTGQFSGITLADFYKQDYYNANPSKTVATRLGQIRAPALAGTARFDYDAAIRGLRKNLILLDFFVYDRKYDPFYERAKQVLNHKKAKE